MAKPAKKQSKVRECIIATRITREMYDKLTDLANHNFRSIAAEVMFAIDGHIKAHERKSNDAA